MKLGYVCKYTPIELFSPLGVEMKRLEPEVLSFPTADALMHPNICSYAKAVFENASAEFAADPELAGIVLTTCCDSIKRLYDALKKEFPDKFFYLLDIPRKVNDFAAELYAGRLRDLMCAFRDFCKMPHPDTEILPEPTQEKPRESSGGPGRLRIGLMGARSDPHIRELLSERNVEILFDLTCTGITRDVLPEKETDLTRYAYRLLNQIPCMRMQKAADRITLLDAFTDRLDGILYHTIKFCDNFAFEYADFKQSLRIPILQIETDCTSGSSGQLCTRVEAFLEELAAKQTAPQAFVRTAGKDISMYVMGIDSGSTSTNAVILNEKNETVAYHILRTGAKSAESADRCLREVLAKAGLQREQLSRIVSTGYGRVSLSFADENITEISCHGKGAHFLNPAIRTILDIGGQDSKAIRLNEKGDVIDFVMNDKCAAGTGRFLEAMARTLEIGIDELGPLSLKSTENVEISSMCTVFAESEVISLIAQNKETADIAHGVHRAIAAKALGMLRKVGLEKEYMMTGGVAKNPGVVAVLSRLLGEPLFISEEPELVGAIGAALYAREQCVR